MGITSLLFYRTKWSLLIPFLFYNNRTYLRLATSFVSHFTHEVKSVFFRVLARARRAELVRVPRGGRYGARFEVLPLSHALKNTDLTSLSNFNQSKASY